MVLLVGHIILESKIDIIVLAGVTAGVVTIIYPGIQDRHCRITGGRSTSSYSDLSHGIDIA